MARNTKKSTEGQVELDPVLDLAAAVPLAEKLSEYRGAELSIDASRVERVGAQCLQVLVSSMKTWEADGFPFHIQHPSENFQSAADALGITIQ